jgi:hypothetical protein
MEKHRHAAVITICLLGCMLPCLPLPAKAIVRTAPLRQPQAKVGWPPPGVLSTASNPDRFEYSARPVHATKQRHWPSMSIFRIWSH